MSIANWAWATRAWADVQEDDSGGDTRSLFLQYSLNYKDSPYALWTVERPQRICWANCWCSVSLRSALAAAITSQQTPRAIRSDFTRVAVMPCHRCKICRP